MSGVQIVTKITWGTTFCTIWLRGIGNTITKTFRIWTYSYTKVSSCWIILEKFSTWWIKGTCCCAKMSVWVSPIVKTNTLLNTFISRSKKRYNTRIRTVSYTLHILIIFKFATRTSTVACSVSSVEIRLGLWTNSHAFFIPYVII